MAEAKHLRVRALRNVYYSMIRIKPGTEFVLDKEEDFSKAAMEAIGWTPKVPGAKVRPVAKAPAKADKADGDEGKAPASSQGQEAL